MSSIHGWNNHNLLVEFRITRTPSTKKQRVNQKEKRNFHYPKLLVITPLIMITLRELLCGANKYMYDLAQLHVVRINKTKT